MTLTLKKLSERIREAREIANLSVSALGRQAGVAEKHIRALERGRRPQDTSAIEAVCRALDIAEHEWRAYVATESDLRSTVEDLLFELTGRTVSLQGFDRAATEAADLLVQDLFRGKLELSQVFDRWNRVLGFYGIPRMPMLFFRRYFDKGSFRDPTTLREAISGYQADAIRFFSTFSEAYSMLQLPSELERMTRLLSPRSLDDYRQRYRWDAIENIDENRLPDLGYISVARLRQEQGERQALVTFLQELATGLESEGPSVLDTQTKHRLRRMDSLLRKFGTTLPHGFLSPLFAPDVDRLRREADRIAPKSDETLARIEDTQTKALRNLAHYLTADHMDIYVATSMRTDADFSSVNTFVGALFDDELIRDLHLRYFNPTQSWIEDRVAKGLVEALMLRRASITIYMAQKEDTFGKDSEASVSLGQGRPVVVYVPKLRTPDGRIDSEDLGSRSWNDLKDALTKDGEEEDRDIDESMDVEALSARLITLRLGRLTNSELAMLARVYWADFDLYSEDLRLDDAEMRKEYRSWLDTVKNSVNDQLVPALPDQLRQQFIRILVAVAMRFERRARIFREVHPLALQVILSTGVLNGIIVVRSVHMCAQIVRDLLENRLDVELEQDEENYRLIERKTKSTIRVISKNQLLNNAFDVFVRSDIASELASRFEPETPSI